MNSALKVTAAALFLVAACVALADRGEGDIEYLLTAVGESGCTFIRNGKEYPADDAEAHLRMKYGRVKKRVSSATVFIEKVASKSFMSGSAYRIRCPESDEVLTSDWLRQRLALMRGAEEPGQALPPEEK